MIALDLDVEIMPQPMTCKSVYWVFCHFWLLFCCTGHRQAQSSTNVAPSGTASQSSTHHPGVASNAIDGNRDSVYDRGSCTHTEVSRSIHWWSLLLPAVYRITSISITNRIVLGERMNNAVILIGNSLKNNGNDNPRCAVISSIPNGATRTFNCGGMIGRMVTVQLNSIDTGHPLTICELEVYGELAAPSPSFSAVLMGRNIAVVEKKLCWSDALFYCRDFYWDLVSIRSEEEQRELEGVLKTTPFALTKHVWLGLRRYLRGSTWFWMSGAPLDYTHWETESNWRLTSPCGGMDTGDSFYWRDLPNDDHLHFICLKDVQTDEDRVEFFSSIRPTPYKSL